MTEAILAKLPPPGKASRSWLCLRGMTAAHSCAVTQPSAAVNTRWLGGWPGCWPRPLPRHISGDRRSPATRACRGTPDGCPREGSSSGLRRPRGCGSSAMQAPGPKAAAVAAGNEVGITGARQCAVPLGSAHLCAGFSCGNMEVPWWRGCGCFPGGQGVAGSNPAVPTVFRTPVPRNGNENYHDHSHRTGRHEHTIQADGQAIPMTRAPMAEIPARRAG